MRSSALVGRESRRPRFPFTTTKDVQSVSHHAEGVPGTDGTNVKLWSCNGGVAQTFRLEDAGGGYLRMVNDSSGKCIDIDHSGNADGTNIHLWTCNGTDAQRWRVAGF
jgi:hypothetical protein